MSESSIYVRLEKEITGKKLPYYGMNPKQEIEDAMSRNDWLGGFSIAVSYLELLGFHRLISYCNSLGKRLSQTAKDELKRINVRQLTTLLFSLRLINRDTYSKMNKTIKERNKLVHFLRGGPDYRDRKVADRAKALLEDAIECIYTLVENER